MAKAAPDLEAGSDAAAPLLQHRHPTTAMGIDEVLSLHAGEFGAWQIRHFVLTCSAWALEAFHTMVMIFADREPPWRCTSATGCGGVGMCGLRPGEWEWVGGAASSTVAEWGLVCGDKYKVGLVQAAFFAGCMLGAGVFGHLSDSFMGRKGSLTIVCILNLVFGLLTSFSPSYHVYLLLRLLTGFSTGGVGLCAFVLATEPIGPSKRGPAGMSTFYFFSSGIALLSLAAYVSPSWRFLYVVSSLPSLLYLALFLPFISESPRWFLIRGRIRCAMQVLNNIAVRNGRGPIPDEVTLAVDVDHTREGKQVDPESYSIVDVIRSPLTRVRLFLAVGINLLCSIVYYGLSLNVVNLKTDLYVSVFLNAVAEMPAYTLTAMLLNRTGRKPMAVATMWLSGGFCLLASAFPTDAGMVMAAVRMGCGVMGIFGMAATYNLLFIYTTELFPTVVRNAALGCATQAGQMGAIVAPLVVVLGERVPFVVFGLSGVVRGLLAFCLPETVNKPLYDTLQGMEEEQRKEDAITSSACAAAGGEWEN